ncbi:MAG: PAS domain S-box protein, partial [Candidatus Odinarchaeota archaeon]
MDLPQNKFLRIIETIKEGYFDVDLRGNYLNCNKSLCELIGYSREELLKLNYKQVTDKENQKTVFEIFNSVYRTGKPRTDLLYQFITKSNEKITAEVSVYLKYDSQGNKIGFYGLIRDVTEKTIAKQKLQESEEKYRNFVENAQEGLLAIDENSYIIFVNPKICEMLGYNRDELMGRSVFSLLKLSRSEIIAIFRDQWEKGLIETFELEFIKKDRTVLSTSVNATSITDENGNFKGSFAFINDITMRKLAEQKLKESEERYRNLIESGPFAIVLVNKQGKISYCNPAFEKLSGYPQEELIGYKFKDLSAIYPEDVPIMVNRFQKNLKGEFLPPLEIELYKKDGNVAWISYQSTLVKVGEESLLQIVIEDVTEKRKADLLIKEEIAKLKELEQIRRDLISRVSHELKTPL